MNVNDLIVRLCLELNDNTNLHFYGSVNDEGSCQITIPKLNVEGKKGDMFIEAIADNVYFKLYEAKVEVKNSVELKMKVTESTMKNEKVSHNVKELKISNSKLELKNEIKSEPETKTVKTENTQTKGNLISFQDYFKNKK